MIFTLVLLTVKPLRVAFSNQDFPFIIPMLKEKQQQQKTQQQQQKQCPGNFSPLLSVRKSWKYTLLICLTAYFSLLELPSWYCNWDVGPVCVPVVKQTLNQKPSGQPISSQPTSVHGLTYVKRDCMLSNRFT